MPTAKVFLIIYTSLSKYWASHPLSNSNTVNYFFALAPVSQAAVASSAAAQRDRGRAFFILGPAAQHLPLVSITGGAGCSATMPALWRFTRLTIREDGRAYRCAPWSVPTSLCASSAIFDKIA
jgi:hypothetical protein